MIRFIAAVDDKLGIADDHGIPWHGKLPTDVKYYHEKVASGDLILMGYGVYKELSQPMRGGVNYVATYEQNEQFRPGFEPIYDARKFLESVEHKDVWNIGGAILFKSTLDLADELYLTRVQGDFHCTKFFPEFEQDFELVSKTEPQEENGITFHFEIWKQKAAN